MNETKEGVKIIAIYENLWNQVAGNGLVFFDNEAKATCSECNAIVDNNMRSLIAHYKNTDCFVTFLRKKDEKRFSISNRQTGTVERDAERLYDELTTPSV